MQTASGLAFVLALGAVSLPFAQAQAPGKGGGDSTPAGVGFSIESEMLTYRALESNSEAIACDVTAFLNGTSVNFTAARRNGLRGKGSGEECRRCAITLR